MLEGCVISLDGSTIVRDQISGPIEHSVALGMQLAKELLRQGADRILEGVNASRRTQHVGQDYFDS
jgi:hydroxymethylbilane synthase